MYKNLLLEMDKRSIKREEIADLLTIKREDVDKKINGESYFKFIEALIIRHEFFNDLSIEYLFEKSNGCQNQYPIVR